MTTNVNPRQLAPAIDSLLGRLRRSIRAYVWLQGFAALVVCLGLAFWLSLALDWKFEPSPQVRVVGLVAVGCLLLFVLYRYILRRAFVALSNRSMAVLVERNYKDFHDGLLTAVELSSTSKGAERFDEEMLAHSYHDAVQQTGGVRLARIFNFGPLARITLAACLLVGSIIAFGIMASNAFAIWQDRVLGLTLDRWPRETHLTVVGFDEGIVKIARGDDYTLVVTADRLKLVIPKKVVVYSRSDDNSPRRRVSMMRHSFIPGRDQKFSYVFKNIHASLEFYIVGGDYDSRDYRDQKYRIITVESPTITEMTLDCVFPEYLVDEQSGVYTPRTVSVSGRMKLPRGTRIKVRAKTNKPLDGVEVLRTNEKMPMPVAGAEIDPDAPKNFTVPLNPLEENLTLSFILNDKDKIRNRRPILLYLNATQDEAPKVAVKLHGIGTEITPQARLPFQGTLEDEYGLTEVWFDYEIVPNPPVRLPIHSFSKGRDHFNMDHAQQMRPLKLVPGQKIRVSIKAADTFWKYQKEKVETKSKGRSTDIQLAALEANVGTSPSRLLNVVTPEKLRLILAGRELILRYRFQTIIKDVTGIRNSLTGLNFADQVADSERAAAKRAALIQAALPGSHRTAQDTLTIAANFENILEELINNGISTKGLQQRLRDEIANPLRKIVADDFSRFDDELAELESKLSNLQEAAQGRDRAVKQADALLVKMKQVLNKMKKAESINRLIERLRVLIDKENKLREKTLQLKKKEELESLKKLSKETP